MQRIVGKISEWLLRDGNTKRLLAKNLNISVGVLNKKLNGEQDWYWSDALVVADTLNCPLDDLKER